MSSVGGGRSALVANLIEVLIKTHSERVRLLSIHYHTILLCSTLCVCVYVVVCVSFKLVSGRQKETLTVVKIVVR